jgi:sodium transport system permease protein
VSTWLVVFKKDLKELFRNRKALLMVTVLPLLLFSAMGVLSNYSLTKTPTVIAVVNEDTGYANTNYGAKLISLIQNLGSSVDVLILNEPNFSLAKKLVQNGEANLALEIPSNFSLALNHTALTTSIVLFVKPGDAKSQVANQIVSTALSQISSQVAYERVKRLAGQNATNIINPIRVLVYVPKPTGFFGTTGSSPYSGLLPALIVLLSVETNIGLIVDSLVGEKERKTLEMLLLATPSRLGLITGKTLAVSVVSVLSAIATIVGLFLEVSLTFSGLAASITPQSLRVSPLAALLIVLVLALTVGTTQLITAVLSAYATNTKEANASIGIVMSLPLISMYPLLFSSLYSLPQAAQYFMYLLPFTYSYLLLYGILIGPVSLFDLIYAIALIAYLFFLLWLTVKLYGRESVITGGGSTFWFKRPRLPQSSHHNSEDMTFVTGQKRNAKAHFLILLARMNFDHVTIRKLVIKPNLCPSKLYRASPNSCVFKGFKKFRVNAFYDVHHG